MFLLILGKALQITTKPKFQALFWIKHPTIVLPNPHLFIWNSCPSYNVQIKTLWQFSSWRRIVTISVLQFVVLQNQFPRMHVLARCIHLWKASNKRDNTSALTNLQNQKRTNIQPSNQDSFTQFQGKILCLKAAQERISKWIQLREEQNYSGLKLR